MKLCRKCKGYGYLPKHRNKPLRMCKKCDGWGKTEGTMTNERTVEISRAMAELPLELHRRLGLYRFDAELEPF